MKKIYFFLATLLGMFGLMNASAQSTFDWSKYDQAADIDNPLIEDVWQFSSPYTETREGSFYALLGRASEAADYGLPTDDFWHSSWASSVPNGTHYFQVEIIDPENLPENIVFWFKRRPTSNDHITEWGVYGTNDPEADKASCTELAYVLTPYGNNTEELTSTPFNPIGFKYLRFYIENTTGTGKNDSRGYGHLSRFQLYPIVQVEEWEAARKMLEDAFMKYLVYAEDGYFPIGSQPGQYGETEVLKFQDAVEAINVYIEQMSEEELKEQLNKAKAEELVNACEEAYQAVLATKVTFSLASGYYRIKAAMEYINSVVIGQDEEGNDITEDQVRQKYMMGHKQDGKIWGFWCDMETFQEDEADIIEGKARALWKIENKGDGTYDFVNMYHDGRFKNVSKSNSVEMDPASENLMAIDPIVTNDDGTTWVNIRVASQNANDFFYLHQNNHGGGTGTYHFLVGWERTYSNGTPGASEWYFEKVDDAEAEKIIEDWAPYKDKQGLDNKIKEMIAEAKEKLEIAKDVSHVEIISEASQFSSPYSQNDLGGKDGGNLSDGVLIDGDITTYWHSVWSASDVYPEGKHYLQVELPEDFDATQQIYMRFTRRDTNNNQITKWSFKGTNDPDADEASCEELGTFESPWNSSNQKEAFKSDLFDTKGYKYIRFYNEENNAGSAFFHLSEFQLYYDLENPQSQYVALGTKAKNLENIVATLEAAEEYTTDDYAKLKEILDAFNEKFVDPAPLREQIAKVEGNSSIIAVGTQPGFWPDNKTGETLDNTVLAAKAYDESGYYTPERSKEFIDDLKAADDAIIDAAIKVKEGKWYRIRFGTEEEYEANNWPTGGNEEEVDDAGNVRNEALFGKYVVVADFEAGVVQIEPDVVALGYNAFLDAEEDIVDKDMSLWRFVNVGDSAYVIQNKATGLFMHGGGNITMSASPSLFTQLIAGQGTNSFIAQRVDGQTISPLHAARGYNVLCTWGSLQDDGIWQGMGTKDGRRACFFVEEVEDVDKDFDGTEFNIAATPGTVRTYCFPTAIKGETGMYELMKAETTDAGISLTICPVKEVAAGAPFIFITEGEATEGAEEDLIPFTHGYDIVKEPLAKNGLTGALYETTVGKGVITLSNGKFSVTKSPSAKTPDCSAYIVNGEEGFEDKPVTITIDIDGDNIQAALENVARTGNIYTIDGRLVGKGNLNSLRNKGIYIVNGTKVIVK